MDFKRSFRAMALLMMGVASFTACEDEEDDLKKSSNKVIYVLNEGSWNNNNASVSAIDPTDGSSYYYQFAAANGRNLGDTGQDILRYGGKIYIAVSGSNTIEVVDGNSLTSIKTIKPESGKPGNPRGLAASDGKIYVSLYDGYVAKIDTTSLAFEDSIAVGPNPEEITIANGCLYVAISDGLNSGNGYPNGKYVSKIGLDSFKVASKINVLVNPTEITSDKAGNVFVISMGNYGDIPATVQKIDKNDSVTVVGRATLMACYENTLYTVNAPWGAPSIEFVSYNTATGVKESDAFITGSADQIPTNPHSISVNPKNGNILIGSYLTAADYLSNGYVYEYANGAFKARYNAGVGPRKFVY
ncbi:MAG: hypothetical protein PUC42_02250 [Bacteroidales bacterium]|jgi:hypothetical protein|nr:hypothetical protein [Bacteroidales bacterium]